MIQSSSKLKNYRLRWLFKPLRLTKFESFWIQVCAIVAVSRILGDSLLISLSFSQQNFFNDSVVIFYCFLHNYSSSLPAAFPPFYSIILESRGTIDSPVLPPGYQSPFCAHRLEGWAFPISHFFFLLVLFLRNPMAEYLFWSALVSDVTFLMVQFLPILPLYLFSQMGGISFCWFESFLLLLPFL